MIMMVMLRMPKKNYKARIWKDWLLISNGVRNHLILIMLTNLQVAEIEEMTIEVEEIETQKEEAR